MRTEAVAAACPGDAFCLLVSQDASIITVCVPLSQLSALARRQCLSEASQYRQHLSHEPAGRSRRAALRKAAARSKRAGVTISADELGVRCA